MTTYGYARVSTKDQDLTIQIDALRAAGCELIREEKRSGTSMEGRQELETLLAFIRPGDVLMITKVDRLARNIGDLQDIVRKLQAKGAALRTTDHQINTETAQGKAFLGMLGVFAEFETNIRKERQLEGIAKAKAADAKEEDKSKRTYKGRTPSIDPERVRAMRSEGKGASEIAKALGIGRASVYRVLEAQAESAPKANPKAA
ncbi:recombinase family protein [Mesorhizobium sp. BR1-1-16]|uniref:recombinase family protein n=1 Tax=Mesorhizobium sp. BR1-1-16 TaxID=2876653 RepID=UPI001CCFABA0|nr:recombinase family protein [Mesorhizobium sp. BR1-1-16]MBZ9939204.1 recombinase family protein [Mesorhizobium sp. BR1-1-16]